MKRERTLRHQLESLDMLRNAVNAMKSVSAHHLREARGGLTAARAYRQGIDALLAATGLAQAPPLVRAPAVLLVGTDLGFCDGYNVRLVDEALSAHKAIGADRFFVIGKRPLAALRRAGVEPARTYRARGSTAEITTLLLALADNVLSDYLSGEFSSLHVVSARFDGVGAFTPVQTRVLPVVPAARVRLEAVTPYSHPPHLAQVAVREYLYSTLYELLLDALAAEHGARLVATEQAGEWLESRVKEVGRQLFNLRREQGTQEVLEIAAGARQRRGARVGRAG